MKPEQEKPLRIVVLPSTFPRNTRDPRGIFYKDQAGALSTAGAEVTVLAPVMHPLHRLPCPFKQFQNISDEALDGFSIYLSEFAGWAPRIPFGNTCFWLLKANKLLSSYRKKYGTPDMVHAHCSINAGYVASIWKQKFGIPYVLTEHSTAFARNLVPAWQVPLARRAFRHAGRRIAVSQAQADYMQKAYPSEGHWITVPNTLSKEFRDTLPVTRTSPPNPFTFLAVGLLKPIKGHANLLKAFAKYFKDSERAKIVIGGEGPERNNLEKLAIELGIADRVDLPGNLTRTQVIQQMDAASAFVLPSQYETFGVVLTEALSRGLPVISTKCGGPDNNVTKDNGYLVPVDDVDALGEKMLALMKNYRQFDQSSIRESACNTFGPEAIGAKLLEICSGITQPEDQKPR